MYNIVVLKRGKSHKFVCRYHVFSVNVNNKHFKKDLGKIGYSNSQVVNLKLINWVYI